MAISVLFDHQIFSWQPHGGISRYFYELSNRISVIEDTHVEIFCPVYVTTYFGVSSKVKPKGIKIPHCKNSGRVLDTLNGTLSKFAHRNRENIDIFHETYYSAFDNCPKSAKRIVTVHDMTHEKYPEYFLSRDNTSRLKAQAVERADHVICISNNTKNDLMQLLDVPANKISVVHHGGSLAINLNQPSEAKRVERPYIFYVGVRGGYKNFNQLLRAYASSSRLREQFSIICFGGGEFTAEEQWLMQSLGITRDHVEQVSGFDSLLARLYANASVFVFPSLYEGFGLPALEAMSYRCPVACADTSSLPEVVGNAAQLFDPADPDDIRSAIENIVFSNERTDLLRTLGERRVKQFSWNKCARETLDVYKKVVNR